jgi:ethanolamine utilization protein EutP (predicted NTPase)
MAEDRVTIDTSTIDDDVDLRQVAFEGAVSGTRYAFAVQYDVLEALSTTVPDADAVALFQQHADAIATLAVTALARDPDQEIVVISENDLD